MKVLASDVIKMQIFSLRLGGPIAVVEKILLDEAHLRIRILILRVMGEKQLGYLLPGDIRLSEQKKMIVDSEEKISEKNEVIRDRPIIERDLTLFNMIVVTVSGKKLGRIENYAFENTSYLVTKLYIRTNLIKNFIHDNLIIDRADIVDIKNDRVIVRDAFANGKQMATNALPVENS